MNTKFKIGDKIVCINESMTNHFIGVIYDINPDILWSAYMINFDNEPMVGPFRKKFIERNYDLYKTAVDKLDELLNDS